MTPLTKGIAVAAFDCLLMLSVAGKYYLDRERLPRVWAQATPVDPNLPVRGRYVSLRVQVETPAQPHEAISRARLVIRDGRLAAERVGYWTGVIVDWPGQIREPVAFFISEHVQDPSRIGSGEELWVEVSVPAQGPPRPLRLGVKKDGVLTPLAMR